MPVSPFIVKGGFCKAQPVDPGNDLFQFWFEENEQQFKNEIGDERLSRTSEFARIRFDNLPEAIKEHYHNALKKKRAKFVTDMKEWLENFKEQRIERQVVQKQRTQVTKMQEAAHPRMYYDSEYSTEASSNYAPRQDVGRFNPKKRNMRFPHPEEVPIKPMAAPQFIGPQNDNTPEEAAAMKELYDGPLGYRRSVMKCWKMTK
jgi:hypothetical protein